MESESGVLQHCVHESHLIQFYQKQLLVFTVKQKRKRKQKQKLLSLFFISVGGQNFSVKKGANTNSHMYIRVTTDVS